LILFYWKEPNIGPEVQNNFFNTSCPKEGISETYMGINTFSQLLMVMFQSSICEVTLPQNVSNFNSVKLHCPKIIAFLLFFRHLSLMILMLSFNGHACKKSEIPSAI
jgi:hypothetical protein